jgi:hypothetical protein
MAPCTVCGGRKYVCKKAWTQGPNVQGVHPAINARRPAYRTVVQFDCTHCKATGNEPDPKECR